MSPARKARRSSSPSEARRTNVLLEKLSAEFRAFGEGLSAVRARVDATFEEVGRLVEKMDRVEDRLSAFEKRFDAFDERLTSVETKPT